jgi:hypothetical protein
MEFLLGAWLESMKACAIEGDKEGKDQGVSSHESVCW